MSNILPKFGISITIKNSSQLEAKCQVNPINYIQIVKKEKHKLENHKSVFSPVAGLFLGIIAVSSASLLIRLAQQEAPSLVIAAVRLAAAFLILFPFCLPRLKQDLPRLDRRTIFLVSLSGLFLAFHFAFWVTSLEYTSVTSSVVLVTTAPLWVALLSPLVLKEKNNRWILMGLGVALLGSIVVALSSNCMLALTGVSCSFFQQSISLRAFWGDLMALVGAWLSGGYLLVGRKVRGRVSLQSYLIIVYGVAALALILMALIKGERFTGYSSEIYVWMLCLAIFPQVIGHSVFNWSLKYLSAAYVSIALLGEPVGTVILSMIFLREYPTLLESLGGVLIMLGIWLATRSQNK